MKTRIFRFGELELRFNWLIALCVIFALSGLVRLGLWQLDRAQEKIAQQMDFEAMGREQAMPIEDLQLGGLTTDAIALQNQHVVLNGEFLNEKTIFLIYQVHEEQLGYEIVTPVKLTEAGGIVMVSRGWSGAGSYEELRERIQPVAGRRQLRGRLFVPTEAMANKTNDLEQVQWPLLIRHLNTLELSPYFEAGIFPYVVRLNEGEPGVLVRHWPTVIVDTSRNFSYSLQWFAMALALLIVSLLLGSNILTLWRRKMAELQRGRG